MVERLTVDPSACPAWSVLRDEADRMRQESIRSLVGGEREFLRIDAAALSFDFSRCPYHKDLDADGPRSQKKMFLRILKF